MELLIVIGVLGILAAGLLAAIDPFEQLKKARDANNRNAAVETVSSLTRYFAAHGAFPWNMTTPDSKCIKTGTGAPLLGLDVLATGSLPIASFEDCFTNTLMADGELKTTFFEGIGSTPYYIASSATDKTNLTVCFIPEGKSLRSDSKTSYLLTGEGPFNIVDQTGLTGAKCPNSGSVDICLQCFK